MEQPIARLTFRKEERLCSKIAIEKLFSSGTTFFISPVKVLVLKSASLAPAPVKVLISVPKKYLRHATDRNRMKRLLREAYRRKKQLLIKNLNLSDYEYTVALIFTRKQLVEFNVIENVIDRILQQILDGEKSSNHPSLK